MKLFLETTNDWKSDFSIPNHVYIFDTTTSLKITGYIKSGTIKAFKFTKPIQFDKRRRTFKEIKSTGLDLSELGDMTFQTNQVKQSKALDQIFTIIKNWKTL